MTIIWLFLQAGKEDWEQESQGCQGRKKGQYKCPCNNYFSHNCVHLMSTAGNKCVLLFHKEERLVLNIPTIEHILVWSLHYVDVFKLEC